MTQLPEPENRPQLPPKRRLWLGRAGLAVLLMGSAAIAGGIWYGRKFVYEQLAPLVQTNLSQSLNRPVQLGKVEGFSWNSLRFGKSEIPETSTDRDRATIDSIDISFDLWQILFTRNLNLDITLNRPTIYLDQDKDGTWLKTEIQQQEDEGPVKTDLKKIRWRDGEVELDPYPKAGDKRLSVKLNQMNGGIDFSDGGRQLAFEADGRSLSDGSFDIKGEALNGKALNAKANLRAQNVAVADLDRIAKLPINLRQGRANANLDIAIRPNQDPSIKGTADFKEVTMQVPGLPPSFTKAKGELQFNNTLIKLENTTAQLGLIPLSADGSIDLKKGFDLSAKIKSATLDNFLRTFEAKLPVAAAGELGADLKITGPLDRPILSGNLRNLKTLRLDRFDLDRVSTNFRLDTKTLLLSINNAQIVPTLGGQITANGLVNLDRQAIAIDYQAQNVPADAIARLYQANPGITLGRVSATGRVTGPLDNVQTVARWQAPEATYPAVGEVALAANGDADLRNAIVQVAGGTVTASGVVRGGRWQGQVQAVGVQAKQFAEGVQGRVSGEFQLAGTTDFNLANLQAQGRARLTEGIGQINATVSANAGQWQAATQIAGVPLKPFSPDLRGVFSGDLNLSGSLTALSPTAVRGDGRVRLSEGISLIDKPLTALVAWDGRSLKIREATAPGFSADGQIFARLEGTPAITGLDLNVRTTNLALANLPIALPPTAQLNGTVDLDARITGTPTAPNVVGNLALRNLDLSGIGFESLLRGRLSLNPSRGINLEIAGNRDRIALDLSPTYRPISVDVQRDGATITGRDRGATFNLDVKNLALDGLPLPGVPIAGGLGGRFSGNFNLDLARSQVLGGTLTVADLRVGSVKNGGFTTSFVNQGNIYRLAETVLKQGDSQYTLSGNLDLRSSPRFAGEVAIVQASVKDLLQTAQVFQLEDFNRGLGAPQYGNAADLQTTSVGNPNTSLSNQLRRLYEITALLDVISNRRRENTMPELLNVQGTFDGKVSFVASLNAGVQANFNLVGKNLEWRPYPPEYRVRKQQLQLVDSRVLKADQVNLIGSFAEGKVNLDPLLVQIGDASIRLAGDFGGETQQGQLTVTNLPIEEISRLYPLPLGINGKFTSSVTVSGSRDNPLIVGGITLAEGSINNTPIQSASSQFTYSNARLNLGTNIRVDTPEPIRISGTIPYRLPFVKVFPDSNNLDLKIQVKDEGLAFLNVLTPQVSWRGGKGEVNLQIGGTLFTPRIQGGIVLNNATIAAQALPEALTGVTGTILFDRDRLRITQPVQGQFSRGRVFAQGVLPILGALDETDPDAATPLMVSLDRLDINLRNLYQGAVNGNVQVGGSALFPSLSGDIRLTDGQVLLADTTGETSGSKGSSSNTGAGGVPVPGQTVALKNLKLTLGDNVQVIRAPILNFLARGELIVNGSLETPKPVGTINLTSGQVNVFTTQFVLARGYAQTAKFLPGQEGLDPELDVRLIASVPEVTRNRAPNLNLFSSSEIADDSRLTTSLGALQTVRIQARAVGPASQLFSNLELTSSPSRTRDEITGLLGGGFVNTLGRGDSTLGLANLAGSALLTNIQGFIGNAVGLSEFRLFPTLLRGDRNRGSTLGLAAELGVDITGKLSASALRVLTADQPTQFGIRYRFNERLMFRGSTDFSGDSRALFEFETRF